MSLPLQLSHGFSTYFPKETGNLCIPFFYWKQDPMDPLATAGIQNSLPSPCLISVASGLVALLSSGKDARGEGREEEKGGLNISIDSWVFSGSRDCRV